MRTSDVCPYCLGRPRDSDDHVFPQFLGGTKTVRACKPCNHGFGHRFEGPVSSDLAPVVVVLSFSGYKHPRVVVYQRAWTDAETGIEYDLDSERQSYPSKPHLIKKEGKVKGIVARSLREARRIAKFLIAKGQAKGYIEKRETQEGLRPPLRNIEIHIGKELRQLAVKMCVAVGQVIVPGIPLLDDRCRRFLLAESPTSSPVRQDDSYYPGLDSLRPPLAHAVYLEADPAVHKCFGVVQFFGGAFQMYVPLSDEYSGPEFAALGTLDVVSRKEEFGQIMPLRIPEPPQFIRQEQLVQSMAAWGQKFNEQVTAAFGQNAILFGLSPKQLLAGLRVSLPLLWAEYSLQFRVELELVPEQAAVGSLVLPSDPRQFLFSADRGKTQLALFESFVSKWNRGVLDRSLGREHIYVPDEITVGVCLLVGGVSWWPVRAMRVAYRVIRRAWATSVDLINCSGELDLAERTILTRIQLNQADLPIVRDPSWPEIEDPDAYEASLGYHLALERWDVDPASLQLSGFRAELGES